MLALAEMHSAMVSIEGLDHLGQAASDVGFMEGLIGLTAVVLLFGTPLIVVVALLRYFSRKQQRQNEVLLKLADKGLPIPPELFNPPNPRSSDLRRGIITLAASAGLSGFFYMVDAQEAMGIGLIPFAIGLGYLLVWYIEGRHTQA